MESGNLEWMYLYRAVDEAGKTVDFYLRRKRDVNASKAFLRKALKGQITLDAYASLTASGCGVEGEWRVAKASAGTDQQVPEQHHRTGPPTSEATSSPDAGFEELPNHLWH